jgi:hypothetical protein
MSKPPVDGRTITEINDYKLFFPARPALILRVSGRFAIETSGSVVDEIVRYWGVRLR